MSERTILVWFRNDLRIHDNEILIEASKKANKILPVYCFDPRHFTKTTFGTLKTGIIRAKFLLESVSDLQKSLQTIGGDLMIVQGKPEELLPEIANKYNISEVYHHREVATEETEISALVEAALWKKQINLKHFIGHTLYHKEDLPFPIKDIPDAFATFRKKVERESQVRDCFETPESISIPEGLEPGKVPGLEDLGFDQENLSPAFAGEFQGGETQGLKMMQEFFLESEWLRNIKLVRSGFALFTYSSRLSPWIALGCLSTREVYWAIKRHEQEFGATSATSVLTQELLWRDYFRFMFKKHSNKFSFKQIFHEEASMFDQAKKVLFEKWQNAQTGIPFIDACMRELNITGFLNNKGRQNVACFLINDLQVNWVYGAAYFEEKLIDYSPASNWGNWANAAGEGNDPIEKSKFDVYKQALELDPKGDYVRKWIPELGNIAGKQVHQLWLNSETLV